MTGYGVGPKLLHLQTKFLNQAQMVCCAGGSFGKPFEAFRGVTQGGPLSSLMFNVCIDALIRKWLCRALGKEATQGRFEETSREIVAFLLMTGWLDREIPSGCRVPYKSS
jgi:hypothetical protein